MYLLRLASFAFPYLPLSLQFPYNYPFPPIPVSCFLSSVMFGVRAYYDSDDRLISLVT